MMNYKYLLDHSLFFNNTILSFSTKNENEYTLNNTFNAMNISNHIAKCNQVHSAEVKYISQCGVYNGIDGLVSNLSNNIYLQIVTADCVPIFMYDEYNGNIGLLHSGWKGTYNNIVDKGIDLFIEKTSKIDDIKVLLGPSIKGCCYEVKEDVSSLFDKEFILVNNNKLYLDMSTKIKNDLLKRDIKKKNIFISDVCTYENEKFHSFRRDKSKSGRIYSIIGRKNF